MKGRPKDFPELPAFDDNKWYHIKLWKKVEHAGRVWTAHMNDIRVRGDLAKEIVGSIYTAHELEAPARQESDIGR